MSFSSLSDAFRVFSSVEVQLLFVESDSAKIIAYRNFYPRDIAEKWTCRVVKFQIGSNRPRGWKGQGNNDDDWVSEWVGMIIYYSYSSLMPLES